MSYASVDLEGAESIRERCIRVAAIVITIRLVWNNCDVDKNEKPRPSCHRDRLQRNLRCVVDLLIGTTPSSMVSHHR